MRSLDGILYGFSIAITPENLLVALAGALVGTMVGVLPGLGPVGAVAILLPATMVLRPETALIMLAGVYYGSMYGGSTTSILLNVPGETASVVTCIDGYQMAKRGRGGAALAVAAVGSCIGGTLGIVGLQLFAPTVAGYALAFGAPEYSAICLLGLLALSRLGRGSFWKSMLSLLLGLVMGTVGMDPIFGNARFTFGQYRLAQGVDLVPVCVGLFGLAEVFLVAERAGGLPQVMHVKLRQLFPSWKEWQRAFSAILRGSVVGYLIGLVPGPGPTIATFASYNLERRISKRPEEFGQGAIEGVAGPETANNAGVVSQMVPMMALGIPWGPTTALLLAGLMMHGVIPGPMLIQEHPQVFWGVVASMYIANMMLLVLNLPLVGMWISVLRIPQHFLLTAIMIFILVGTYSLNNSMLDLMVLAIMGIVGYLLRKADFDVSPMILALVLGPMLEKTFRQSLIMSQGDPLIFLKRPISGAIIAMLLVILVAPTVWRLAVKRRKECRRSGV